MYSLKAFVLLFSVVASVNALTTPLVVRHAHHRAVAARAAAPEPIDVPVANLVKRQNPSSRRCKNRPSNSSSSKLDPAPTSSTVQQARPDPTPSPTPKLTPKPTSTPAAPKPSTPPSKPLNNNNGGDSNLPSFMVGTQTGQGTFYATGLGACGITNNDNQFIAAVSHLLFDQFPGYARVNPNKNPMCGRTVTATFQGRSVTVALTDRCTGCALTDLDFSPAAFAQLTDGNFGLGRISGVKWTWD